MSYAYIQGREAEALAFFQTMLNQALDPNERAQLEKLVDELRQKVTSKEEQAGIARGLQNVAAHNLQTC
jgi:hypothetical protein